MMKMVKDKSKKKLSEKEKKELSMQEQFEAYDAAIEMYLSR